MHLANRGSRDSSEVSLDKQENVATHVFPDIYYDTTESF